VGISGTFTSIKDHQIQRAKKCLQSIQNFSSCSEVYLTQFVLHNESFLPGVAAEVENVGKDTLFYGARGEGGAESVQRGWDQAG
jgi:hypothetical protein